MLTKIIWTVAVMTMQGPMVQDVPEPITFKDKTECEKWGTEMTPRMADWVRGAMKAHWDYEVMVVFHCEPDGQAT